jgi:hypothetical protein
MTEKKKARVYENSVVGLGELLAAIDDVLRDWPELFDHPEEKKIRQQRKEVVSRIEELKRKSNNHSSELFKKPSPTATTRALYDSTAPTSV